MKNIFFGLMLISSLATAVDIPNSPIFANPDIKNANNWIKIKAGSFQMGTPTSEIGRGLYSDETLHDVTISHDFEIQSTVVTQAQYLAVTSTNTSYFSDEKYCTADHIYVYRASLCPNNPVEQVSWFTARDFIDKLNSSDAVYFYRLPTEAEWEYAARAGSQAAYWYGNNLDLLGNYAWVRGNSAGQTHAVGSKPANPWGLYDVHGNVMQWTSDWYAPYLPGPQTDPDVKYPRMEDDQDIVLRGGDYDSKTRESRSGNRSRGNSQGTLGGATIGFRLVRTHK